MQVRNDLGWCDDFGWCDDRRSVGEAVRAPIGLGASKVELPAGQDQVGIVECAATAHVVAGIVLPDLRPCRRITELLVGDVPQRVATLNGVGVRVAGGRGLGGLHHRRRDPICGNLERPSGLDVRRGREPLPGRIGASRLASTIDSAMLDHASRIGARQPFGDRVHRFAGLDDVRHH